MTLTRAALCIATLCALTMALALANHPGNVLNVAVAGEADWRLTWTPVTTNIDGTPVTGVITYEVQRQDPGPWSTVARVAEPGASVPVGEPCVWFQVRAIEDGTNPGNWSAPACGRLGKLTAGPRYVVARNSAYLTRPAYATSGGLRSSTPIGRVAIGEPCDAAITIGSYLSVAGQPNVATPDPSDTLPPGTVAVCELAP